MDFFNYYGLAIIAAILIPNIIYALAHKQDGEPTYRSKLAEILEQIGRYACMLFTVINIPYTYFGFWFAHALIVYLSVNGGLCALYILFWIICGNKPNMLRALSLSIIPSVIFIFGGVMIASIPLLVFAVTFAAAHIFISVKSVETISLK